MSAMGRLWPKWVESGHWLKLVDRGVLVFAVVNAIKPLPWGGLGRPFFRLGRNSPHRIFFSSKS
jgi:hypothetical protein